MLFDGDLFYTLELKTFADSCSFERTKEEKGIIHYYQIKSLKNFYQYKNVCSGFILDFRKTDHTYFLSIEDWDTLIASIDKKSFNENDLLKHSDPILIEKKKLKVNYRYNIQNFLNDIKKKGRYNNGLQIQMQ